MLLKIFHFSECDCDTDYNKCIWKGKQCWCRAFHASGYIPTCGCPANRYGSSCQFECHCSPGMKVLCDRLDVCYCGYDPSSTINLSKCATKFDVHKKQFPSEKDFNKAQSGEKPYKNLILYAVIAIISLLMLLTMIVIGLCIRLKKSNEFQNNRKNFLKNSSTSSNFNYFSCQQNA